MEIRRRTAAALTGIVVLIGGLAAGCSTSAEANPAGQGEPGQNGGAPGDREPGRDLDTGALVTALAEELGLDEATVKTAVDDAMSSVMGDRGDRPDGTSDGEPSGMPSAPPSGAPTDGGQGGRGDQLAQKLAEVIASALGVDEAKVLSVVQEQLPAGGRGRPGENGDEQQPSPAPSR